MRLQYLLESVNEEMLKKITENQKAKENLEISEEEAKETAKMIALAAIKYGDLSNQASKDYIFDIDRFTSFEGNTGPYILYTIVRIKSILNKYHSMGKDESGAVIEAAHSASEKNLMRRQRRIRSVLTFMSWRMHSTAFTMRQRSCPRRTSRSRSLISVC